MVISDLITLPIKCIHPMDFFVCFFGFKALNHSELNLTFAPINTKTLSNVRYRQLYKYNFYQWIVLVFNVCVFFWRWSFLVTFCCYVSLFNVFNALDMDKDNWLYLIVEIYLNTDLMGRKLTLCLIKLK